LRIGSCYGPDVDFERLMVDPGKPRAKFERDSPSGRLKIEVEI
jgi:hypothetical protein